MVLAFVIIFILCFLPYHIFNLWFHFDPKSTDVYDDFWHAFRIIGFCLSFINSCINPITLYCVSGTFRKHFNKYLFCCCVDTRGRRSLSRRGNSATICESSSHTLVHFNSTVRRHCSQLQDFNCSVTSTHTTVFNLDKTWKWPLRVSGGKRRQLHVPHGNSHQSEVGKSSLNSDESSDFPPKRTTTVTFKTWSQLWNFGWRDSEPVWWRFRLLGIQGRILGQEQPETRATCLCCEYRVQLTCSLWCITATYTQHRTVGRLIP
jgi:hypothetical protein